MFKVRNLRTGEENRMSSEELKERIITQTRSRYENSTVLPERTGLRPENLDDLLTRLNDNIIIQRHVYIVTALNRINNNRNTRYMIIIDGDKYDKRIINLFYNNIPIYSVKIEGEIRETGRLSALSQWFRATMGRGFSFIDIDYCLINYENNKIALIEEKIGTTRIGYGQELSYRELLADVIINCSFLLFIFNITNVDLNTTIQFRRWQRNLYDNTMQYSTLNNLANIINNNLISHN